MAQKAIPVSPQLDGSVNTGLAPPLILSGGNLEPDAQRWGGILGTPVDTGATCFPTVPAGFDANRHYYPGLAASYLGAAYVESPQHRQLRQATADIPSIQLTVRGAISPQVLQRWQLSQVSPALLPIP